MLVPIKLFALFFLLICTAVQIRRERFPRHLLLLAPILAALGGCGGSSAPTVSPTTPVVPVGSTTSAALHLLFTSPAANANNASTTGTVVAVFDQPLDAAGIADAASAGRLALSSTGGNVGGSFSVSTSALLFAPASPLQPQASYTLTLPAGLPAAGGGTLAETMQIAFTTQVMPPSAPFAAVNANPAPGALNVDPFVSPLFGFSYQVDPTSVAANTISLAGPLGAVAGTRSTVGNIVALAPAAPLVWGTTYSYTATTALRSTDGAFLPTPATVRFTTRAASWQPAQDIQNTTHFMNSPQVAVNAAGDAIAVWQEDNGNGAYNVHAARYDAASAAWQPAVMIQNDTRYGSAAQVAMDDAGNAIAVWEQSGSSGYFNITAARYDAATSAWQPPVVFQNGGTGATDTHLAMDAQGNAMAVWTEGNIQAAYYDAASNAWQPAAMIQSGTDNADSPQLAMNAAGDAIAVWRQENGNHVYEINAARYDVAEHTWHAAGVIQTGTNYAFKPNIAMDPAGNAIAVWAELHNDNGDPYIYTARYDSASSTWQPSTILKAGPGNSFELQIAMDSAGNAMLLSPQQNSSGVFNINVTRYVAATAAWQPEAVIQSVTDGASGSRIAFDPAGNAIAVWRQSNSSGTSSNVYAGRYDASTGVWQPARLIQPLAGYTDPPGLAVNEAGSAIAVWTYSDGSSRIQAARFAGSRQ